jgi:hypothetical protein
MGNKSDWTFTVNIRPKDKNAFLIFSTECVRVFLVDRSLRPVMTQWRELLWILCIPRMQLESAKPVLVRTSTVQYATRRE